jgi:hypothetical protein
VFQLVLRKQFDKLEKEIIHCLISQQPENCENRNDPDLVQAFLKKWWVESDFQAPNRPFGIEKAV